LSLQKLAITLAATWTEKKFNVSFVVDGTTVKTVSVQEGEKKSSADKPEKPTKDGYNYNKCLKNTV
jgi:hypothetical protein